MKRVLIALLVFITFNSYAQNNKADSLKRLLRTEIAELLKTEAASKNDLLTVFKELGYEIK